MLRPEYASAAFVNASTLLVTDGHGTVYILVLSDDTVRLLASYELRVDSSSVPFKIHNSTQRSPTYITAVLSSKSYQVKPEAGSKKKIEFDVWGVQLSLQLEQIEQVLPMEVQWHRRGEEVPIYTTFDASHETFLLFGGSPYIPKDLPSNPSYSPTADEMAPIPRLNEDLDRSDNPNKNPPPYSWTQSSDSLTMAFPLPSSTQKTDIKVAFTPKTLTVLVSNTENVQVVPLPRYSLKSLWDSILPSTSFWTWDREGEKSFGLLTLHIDKTHEGTRWPQVFAATPENQDVEVQETLDPTELYNIRETLEKFTASSLANDDSGLGLGSGVPSLGKGEIDDELDASIGRLVFMTRVRESESSPPTPSAPITVLSTPLPGRDAPPSLIVKNGIDGLFCALENSETWSHKSTFPALAFVLASKQDTRFTYHLGSRSVMAFESGSRELGFNVYIYEATPTPQAKWAKQSVLRVGDSSSGPLLGINAVKAGDRMVILCLCERELVVLQEFPM